MENRAEIQDAGSGATYGPSGRGCSRRRDDGGLIGSLWRLDRWRRSLKADKGGFACLFFSFKEGSGGSDDIGRRNPVQPA